MPKSVRCSCGGGDPSCVVCHGTGIVGPMYADAITDAPDGQTEIPLDVKRELHVLHPAVIVWMNAIQTKVDELEKRPNFAGPAAFLLGVLAGIGLARLI